MGAAAADRDHLALGHPRSDGGALGGRRPRRVQRRRARQWRSAWGRLKPVLVPRRPLRAGHPIAWKSRSFMSGSFNACPPVTPTATHLLQQLTQLPAPLDGALVGGDAHGGLARAGLLAVRGSAGRVVLVVVLVLLAAAGVAACLGSAGGTGLGLWLGLGLKVVLAGVAVVLLGTRPFGVLGRRRRGRLALGTTGGGRGGPGSLGRPVRRAAPDIVRVQLRLALLGGLAGHALGDFLPVVGHVREHVPDCAIQRQQLLSYQGRHRHRRTGPGVQPPAIA